MDKCNKRLVVISLGNSFGGTEVYIRSLAALLASDLSLSAILTQPALISSFRAMNIPCSAVPAMSNIAKPVQLGWCLVLILRKILRREVDAVLVNGYSEILLLPFVKLFGMQAFATRHLSFEIEVRHWWQNPERFMARWAYRKFARCADCIICVSKAVEGQLCAIVPRHKVQVIPNWIAIASSTRQRRTMHEPPRLLFVGRLTRLKGLHVLLEAIRLLTDEGAPPVPHLIVVGQGEYEEELRKMAAGLPVTFVGFQVDAGPFYQEADIFVNPSQGPEGLPLVTLEAMAHGLPCILSDLPVFQEVAGDEGRAMIFARNDPAELAGRIKQMQADPELQQRYSAAALSAIEKRHSPDVARRAYLTTLNA